MPSPTRSRLPAIPIALWFSVLFIYHQHTLQIPVWLNWFMITVGIVFVINSLDSLIRLYSANLGWSRDRLGDRGYYPLHFLLQLGLVGAYFFTPFEIQWVGLIVVAIYAAVYGLIFLRQRKLGALTQEIGT
ncbi:hypothetical protein [Roseovarius mucosus]|uniref:hypothetical protein n=1 Tax=Roseovarius mucosus TaxID=215743 RepID=UPI003F71EAAE